MKVADLFCNVFFACCAFVAGVREANADQPLLGVQHMSVGYYNTCAVVNGGARCFGYNDNGQLGNGSTTPTSSIVSVTGLGTGVTALTEGFEYGCAIVNGGVACWGTGYLGNGAYATNSVPVGIAALGSGVTTIAGGSTSTCAIIAGGVQCWGSNGSGQLGNGTMTASAIPIAVPGLGSAVTAIAAGRIHDCAIAGGGAQCWGDNMYGQLGNGSFNLSSTPVLVTGLTTGVTALAAGDAHTCAIVNGGVQCWGDNTTLQLGDGVTDYLAQTTPVNVVGLGAGSGVVAITAGQLHTCVLVNNDATHPVKCWGYNADGQLGNGSIVDSSVPVDVSFPALKSGDIVSAIAAGGSSSCALIVSAGVTSMNCWGSNGYGQLGVAGPPAQSPVATSVVGLTSGVSALGMGGFANHSCAVVNAGAQCWGSNGTGQIGNGIYSDTSVAQPVSGLTAGVTVMATGYQHTCAVVNGGAECWGDNESGELGNGTVTRGSATPVAVSGLGSGSGVTTIVASGDNEYFGSRSCAIVNGGAQCWGDNRFGELGNGTTTSRVTPIAVTGLSSGVTAIAAGPYHTCAIVNGGAQCWGNNPGGELGNGTTTDSMLPVAVSGVAASGATAITAGTHHTCAIVAAAAYCWGQNFNGQLGNGTASTSSAVPVAVTGLDSAVSAISAGDTHTCAVVNGAAQCWGSNSNGQLGNDTHSDSATAVAVSGLESGVVAISAAQDHTCALLGSGAEKCWGSDQYGQLGDHRFVNTGVPQVVVVANEIFRNGFE